jgi:hypothetical protein
LIDAFIPTCIYSCIDVWSRIRLNSIKFCLNVKSWTLETFFYIPLAFLVKFPAVSLYFLFYFSSRLLFPHRPSTTTYFSQCAGPVTPQPCLCLFYIIPFKPNLFFKENNSKIFFETPFYKIVLTLYLIIFHRVFGIKIILFIPLFSIFYILVYLF